MAMLDLRRRALLIGSGTSLAMALGACVPRQGVHGNLEDSPVGQAPGAVASEAQSEQPFAGKHSAAAVAEYGPVEGERFPVPAAPLARINPAFLRSEVAYAGT